jgi:hypothetical protein
MIVAAALGYVSAFFGAWVCALVILVMIPLTIEIGQKVIKRDRL